MTGSSPLSIDAVRQALSSSGPWTAPVSVVASTGSTNDDAKRAAAAGAPAGSLFAADRQEAGRGQRGRTWEAAEGSSLLFSCVVRPRIPAASLPPLSLVVGLVVAQRVAAWLGRGSVDFIGVKWPNDVYARGKKLAGILVEAQITGAEVGSVIIGVGLNVTPAAFSEAVRDRAISLEDLGVVGPREPLLGDLVRALAAAVERYEAGGLSAFLDELRARDVARGRVVTVDGVPAVATGVDDRGQLLVQRGGAIFPITSGDVVFSTTDTVALTSS